MPLLNAFVDAIVSVGFSAERGLIIDPQSEDNSSPLSSYLQPYVLAILTADQAAYPETEGKYSFDQTYPLISNVRSPSEHTSNTKSQKKQTVPNSFSNLPIFCSPDGVKISHLYQEGRIHHIVFTQEEGKRSYAVVLTFQEKFILKNNKPEDDGTYQIESLPMHTVPVIKTSNSRKVPSSYRHTNPQLSTSSPSYSSHNIVRTQQQNAPFNLGTNEKSMDSSDRQIELTNSGNNSSNTNTPSRMRSSSNLSSLPQKLTRSTFSLAFDTFEPFYLPHYVVLISSHPYWTAMHEVISTIYNEIRQKKVEVHSNDYKILIQKYAFLACNTPIPPIAWERFSLSFSLIHDQSVITFDPPIQTNRSVLDLDLTILLLTLNIGKLLEVLAAILTQQPIIFFSSDYSKLVTTLECLLYLIYPFKWIHTYIPIVPYNLRDYCLEGPPGSYIMGIHSRYESMAEELDTSFKCNLDNDKSINVPPRMKFPHMPPAKLRRFIRQITEFVEKIKIARSRQNIHGPINLRYDEKSEIERRERFKTNNKIVEIFLDLMVDLCDDTLKAIYWKMDHQQSNLTNFSKEKYLLSKTEGHERDFYRMFIESTAFQLFIEEERTSTTPTEFRKICQLRAQINQDQPYHFNITATTDRQVSSRNSLFDPTSTQMLLPLPDWPLNISTHYLDHCIDTFNYELENAEEEHSSPVISTYGYLSGCALLARGYLIEGLRNLYLIEDQNLFPKDYIQTTILPLLSDSGLLDRFHQESFYIKSPDWKKIIDEPQIIRKLSQSSAEFPLLPVGDLSFDQFHDYVHRSSIVSDRETAEILFNALLHWVNTTTQVLEAHKPRRRWSMGGNTSREPSNLVTDPKKGAQTIDFSPNSSLPSKLFELFLEIWQQTNAEKDRMNYCLPKDRQKQESILKISSKDVISKNNGRGKLILTPRGLYLLPDAHSSASLLTELIKIVVMDLYQHKTIFSSSKPAIRIYALYSSSPTNPSSVSHDGEPLDMLIFQDNYEQNFWYKIIWELWSGVSIAQEECDTTVFHKISTNIALMDTLANIDYNDSTTDKKSRQKNNQACIDKALNDLTIFTRMQKNGTFKRLTNETRKALHDRLSPSINENERHAVRCLILTENPDKRYSLLWCAYGNKLKIFNTKTWICDPNDLSFPSIITCMCLDASNKLWVGCIDGQLFIVDTIQRICGKQLALIKGSGGCQTIAFDIARNHILVGSRSGLVIIWNTINKQRLNEINLDEIYRNISVMQQKIYRTEMLLNLRSPTQEPNMNVVSSSSNMHERTSTISDELKSIQIYEDLLFAGYRDDYILIFRLNNSNTYNYEQIVSVKYQDHSTPINSFLVYNQQLWISASYIIYVFNISSRKHKITYDLIMKKHLDNDHLLTMLGVSDYIWAGSSRGNVYIFRMDNYELLKTFDGHKDGVCCLCPMFNTYIISGSQKYDTSIVIWENIQTNGIIATTRF